MKKGFTGVIHHRLDTVPGPETVQRWKTERAKQVDHALRVTGGEGEGGWG